MRNRSLPPLVLAFRGASESESDIVNIGKIPQADSRGNDWTRRGCWCKRDAVDNVGPALLGLRQVKARLKQELRDKMARQR